MRATAETSKVRGALRNDQFRLGLQYVRTRAVGSLSRIALLLVAFVVSSAYVWHRAGASLVDVKLLNGYVPTKTSALFRVCAIVTEAASPGAVIVVGLLLALFTWRRSGSAVWSLACIAAPGIAGVAETALKFIVSRPRPPSALLTGEDGNGFPSGHVTGFTAFAIIAVFVFAATKHASGTDASSTSMRGNRLVMLMAIFASIVIGVTRVVVGAHYPTDAVGGLILGAAIAEFVAMAAKVVSFSWGRTS